MSVKRNPNLGPSQMRARKRRLFWIRFSIVTFLLLIIIFTLAIFSGHEKIKIQTIIISGNAVVSDESILQIANRDMSGRYGYLFSRKNSLIFPRFKIKADILNELKAIKEANISWRDWRSISIKVSERKPQAVWCGSDIAIKNSTCYFLDKKGYIFGPASHFSGSIFVKYYGGLDKGNPVGEYFLPENYYIQLYNLTELLADRGLKVSEVLFDDFDFKFILEIGPVIIFNNKNSSPTQTGFEVSFGKFLSALETNNLDLKRDAEIIDYIDLRFDNKILVGKKK
jgi:hypothetical protein